MNNVRGDLGLAHGRRTYRDAVALDPADNNKLWGLFISPREISARPRNLEHPPECSRCSEKQEESDARRVSGARQQQPRETLSLKPCGLASGPSISEEHDACSLGRG